MHTLSIGMFWCPVGEVLSYRCEYLSAGVWADLFISQGMVTPEKTRGSVAGRKKCVFWGYGDWRHLLADTRICS